MRLFNPTKDTIRFSMDGRPGEAPTVYEAAPGGDVEVPDLYVTSGTIARLAPGLTAQGPAAKNDSPKAAAPPTPSRDEESPLNLPPPPMAAPTLGKRAKK